MSVRSTHTRVYGPHMYRKLTRYEEGLQYTLRALGINPKISPRCMRLYGGALAGCHRYEASEKWLLRGYKAKPSDPYGLFGLAHFNLVIGVSYI